MIANTPSPPYYAVIFSNMRTKIAEGYEVTAMEMLRLAEDQEGYLGHESVRDGLGITISYWENLESISRWKQQTDHLVAQKMGRENGILHIKPGYKLNKQQSYGNDFLCLKREERKFDKALYTRKRLRKIIPEPFLHC